MEYKYEETAQILNEMAKVKMAMNSHKGNIEDKSPATVVTMLKNEVSELAAAVSEEDLMHIIEEAADVQNFLLATVHQAIRKYRSRKDETK